MSKTLKDKANHFLHHLKTNNIYFTEKSKYKYEKEDVPADILKKLQELSLNNKAIRHGNNRKYFAALKDRRMTRIQNNQQCFQLQKEDI